MNGFSITGKGPPVPVWKNGRNEEMEEARNRLHVSVMQAHDELLFCFSVMILCNKSQIL